MARAPDLDFKLRARDETQQAFEKATRRAQQFEAAMFDAASASQAVTRGARASEQAFRAQDKAMRATAARGRQLSYQLVDIGQALATAPTMGIYALQNLGFQVAQIGQLYAGQGGFKQAVKDSTAQVAAFAGRMAPLAAVASIATAAIAGMRHEINSTGDVAVGFGDVFRATIEVAASSIANTLKPAIDVIGPFVASAWDWIAQKTVWLGNTVINAFRVVGADIKYVFETIPTIVQAAAVGAANGVVRGVNAGVQKAAEGIDWLIDKANKIPGVDIGRVGQFQALETLDNPASADLERANAAHRKRIEGILASDPLGDFYQKVAGRARELAAATDEAGDAAKRAQDPWKGLRDAGTSAVEAIKQAGEGLGQSVGGILQGLLDKTLSWKDAALQAIRSVLQYMDKVNVAKGGAGLGGGGIAGGFLKGILGFANGTNFAPGGLAIVGERGPELINLPRGSQVIPNHRLPAANSNMGFGQSGSGRVAVDVRVSVDDDGTLKAIVEQSAQGAVVAAAPSIVQKAKGETIRDIAPGGRSAKGLSGAWGWSATKRRAS